MTWTRILRVTILKFGDDVTRIGRVDSEDDVFRLRINLISSGGWSEKFQMKFNVEKCKVLNIGFRNREEPYGLNGAPLGIIKEEKDWVISLVKI